MRTFTLHTADVTGRQTNSLYPNRHQITNDSDLAVAARFDHVAATYKNNHRSNENFLASDCVVMDIDNDHTENPEEWITPDSLSELMAGVAFMTATSRNHMKTKGTESARPRFHVYYPIDQISDASEYAGLKKYLAARFSFFDANALDAGRFIYGNPAAEVAVFEGVQLLDAWLTAADEQDMFAVFDASTQAIGKGSRNATLSRFAGRVLIRYGNTTQARELFDRKAALCDPPLPAGELAMIWDSACKFAAKVAAQPDYVLPEVYRVLSGLRPGDFSDVGQADLLAAEYANKIRYSPSTKWLVYNGSFWEENELTARGVAQELTTRQLEEAKTLLSKAGQQMSDSGAEDVMAEATSKKKGLAQLEASQLDALDQLEAAQAYRNFVTTRRTSKNISATLKEAAPILQVAVSELDEDAYLLNTPDGSYDLRTGARMNHDPADLLTKQTTLAPTQEGARIWLEALDVFFQANPELIGYVQRICGLAVIGRVMVEALVIAYGDGRNGKSTFWNTIARVLGTYAGTISADALTVGVRRNVKPELAEARGKRLLIAAETEEGMRLSTSNVKQLASTDQITAEKKYKDPFAFTPSHTLVLYTNHLPRVGAMDTGIWRRLIVIPFEAKIEGNADIKNYADYLYEHAGGAVLAWVMEGARAIHADDYHLDPPRQVIEASNAYRDDNDWFSQFLEDQCETGEGLSERAGDLYHTYRAWAQATSGWARPMIDFNAATEQAGYVRKKTKTGIRVFGLAIKSEFCA
ncbi:phage/plasmid primase, P4 family domain-containing protein [Propionimicrobium lymphophilum ACS-093-V-SCH5]|uniref:Phage/plasmid primase, P4 family domain-containing protein n=1 Tax=Propionimicrobium lymphophilum ACS-093-V-SCH5 TaxID=883161 RepID=S2W1K7_9ACTN|nr:phage/plasmid primase, P4 family [Propionimicrobium lymphophilum]EPD33658.1 phage/plasmid primase, P4 family domain-containing protein [Propionimicrobium lymphophilum ACS-093-V-SCH5]